ncbi:chromosome segregation protein SMC [Ectothiorhodospiraceae bacterium BW-2]|nr:chromosome segregation protein SMC [Ectothiorhodospiraceae bacterium BW-2]
MNDNQLSRIVLSGYKSIRQCDLELKELNVLIGPNGAGKSNFISFFKLVQQMLEGKLQRHIGLNGGADSLLHFGRKKTEQITAALVFQPHAYTMELVPTQDNRLMFDKEQFMFNNMMDIAYSGHFETASQDDGSIQSHFLLPVMRNWRLYHFHDTSESALVKQRHGINDNAYLRPDARNLAAFLYRLQKNYPQHYQRIVRLVQFIAPFFGDFYLRPNTDNPEYIELEWTEQGEDRPFKAHQLSDGTLRFICLATLLNQPEEWLPETILIDEPELGLHPRAIGFLASMLRSTAKQRQLIVSTQSVTLVNGFSVDDLIVVERQNGVTVFQRHDEKQFQEWLKEYTVGDLWEKNLLGGRG